MEIPIIPKFLLPQQIEHFNCIREIMSKFPCAIDKSVMGTGKTYVTCALASIFNLSLFVICPASTIGGWKEVTTELKIPFDRIMSYESLHGSSRGPKHGWLSKDSDNNFYATRRFEQLSTQGILMVLDEGHRGKKVNTLTSKACSALSKCIVDQAGYSRLIVLSGTPIEEGKHAEVFLRKLGLATGHLFTNDPHNGFHLTGMKDLIKICRIFNKKATKKICKHEDMGSAANVRKVCMSLLEKVVFPTLSSTMAPPKVESKHEKKSMFLSLDQKHEVRFKEAVNGLASTVQFDKATGTTNMEARAFGMIIPYLIEMECCKMNNLIHECRQKLSVVEGSKVVILLNYIKCKDPEHISCSSVEEGSDQGGDLDESQKGTPKGNHLMYLSDAFKMYNPAVIHGGVNLEKRQQSIQAFQQDAGCRVFLATIGTGCEGINLHDTIGNEPRFMYILPNYRAGQIHQASHRIYREGTKSEATITLVFGPSDAPEKSILSALSRKGGVLKRITDHGKYGVLFPGEYDEEVKKGNKTTGPNDE